MLDKSVTKEDREILLEALKNWGALDDNYGFTKNHASANRRGYEIAEGGGLTAPEYSDPMSMHDVLQSKMWAYIGQGFETDHQSTIFQPVGGMGRIGDAFAKELGPIIKLNCKVTEIKQDTNGVTVSYVDTMKGGPVQTATAEYCINTIPAPVLSQIPMQVSPKMKAAIMACQYSTNFKAGLQFKRKFWEEDEAIYGGISYTDLPISLIGYPNTGYAQTGKGILLGAYVGGRPATHEFAAMAPEERLKKIVAYGAQIHPQYNEEYENGISVAWSRLPWIAGCLSSWTEERRAQHYQTLISFDGRMLLAGEHASYGIWQEHAILSGLNAIKTLHQRVTAA
jgi:monoamine oxidase